MFFYLSVGMHDANMGMHDILSKLGSQPRIFQFYFMAELQRLPSKQLAFYPVLEANPGSFGFTLGLSYWHAPL
jgi:hypothetical protein